MCVYGYIYIQRGGHWEKNKYIWTKNKRRGEGFFTAATDFEPFYRLSCKSRRDEEFFVKGGGRHPSCIAPSLYGVVLFNFFFFSFCLPPFNSNAFVGMPNMCGIKRKRNLIRTKVFIQIKPDICNWIDRKLKRERFSPCKCYLQLIIRRGKLLESTTTLNEIKYLATCRWTF